MSERHHDPKLRADFSAFAGVAPATVRLADRTVRVVYRLSHATPRVIDYVLSEMTPQDLYVIEYGVGIDSTLVSRLSRLLESSKPTAKPEAKSEYAAFDEDSTTIREEPPPRVPAASSIGASISTKEIPEELRWVVCNRSEAKARQDDVKQPGGQRARILERLVERSVRRLPKVLPKYFVALEQLARNFPNFRPVIDEVSTHLRFRLATGMPLELPPILMSGPPGIGKTEFARRLAGTLELYFELRSLAEMTASFVITGSNRSWGGAAPGLVAKAISELPNNSLPLILLDELDKVHLHGNHPPDAALLGLLEPKTAERFHDECLDMTLNARPIVWMFTCNDIMRVQGPLLSRLRVIEIEAPTAEQMPAVVRSIDFGIRESNPAIAKLFHPLSNEVVGRLGRVNPRQLARLLPAIYGAAATKLTARTSKRRVLLWHIDKILLQRRVNRSVAFGFAPANP
ncbi:AAA family ATPase [Nevskia ramosa]|uniref:AAA family ATPase n=1 Tax=Nevskia ramosa TaxID=64002 RepID=UPI003D0CD395